MTSILGSNSLFNQLPQISTYPNIACLIAAQTPIAQTLNGQSLIRQYIDQFQKENASKTNKVVQLGQIAKYYQFNLFKTFVPKLIFNRFVSRHFPGSNAQSGTNFTNSDYASEVQFKIDFDSSVISDLVALITMNIAIDESVLSDNTLINIQGYSSRGPKSGISVKYSDVLSLQFAYCEDFLYHYISTVELGFCNTGGSNPIYHQKVPIEIAWIYHRLILPQEMGDAVKRLCREDIFTIGHDPFHMYGNFMFQMKASNDLKNYYSYNKGNGRFNVNRGETNAAGMNEIAMYYVQNQIKGVEFAKTGVSEFANPTNWTIGKSSAYETYVDVNDAEVQKTHQVKKFNVISMLDNVYFGEFDNYNVDFSGATNVQNTNSPCPIMVAANSTNLSFDNIMIFFKQTRARLPYASYGGYKLYMIPTIAIKVDGSNGIKSCLGFVGLFEASQGSVSIQQSSVVISGSISGFGDMQTSIKITIGGAVQGNVVRDVIVGDEVDQEDEIVTAATGFNFKQTGINVYHSCFAALGVKSIVPYVVEQTENKYYVLNQQGQLEGDSGNISSTDKIYENMCAFLGFDEQANSVKEILSNVQKILYGKTGYISPYINVGSLNYMLVESNDFDENDFGWDAMYRTYYKNNVDQAVYPNNADLINDMFRYNMAMLNNKQNEEFAPTLRNPDYISIHTFRHEHGVVDFYFPLNFLFICQGISSGFPHYACASQSLVVKFTFLNPKAFINTCIVVKPTAVDPLDTSMQARVYINRINTHQLFTTNSSDMRMILFYNRYVWIPELTDIITNYNKYVWVIKNYERIYRDIGGQVNGQTVLYEFGRSVFYTKIWMFIINTDTYNVMQSQGGMSQIQPLYVNKYHLPIFDVCSFQESNAYNTANSMTGTSVSNWNKQYNSPYGLVPVDSFQLTTNSTIGMQDNLPYRLQQFSDYVMLNHTQAHQTITNNNLVQFNIDPIFYQEGTPNSTYAPAYAPTFYVKYNPKMNTGYNKKYGCILISECMNISYISNHVMLSKYQTDN